MNDKSQNIMVIDDYKDCADTLALLLKVHGYGVTTAYSGHEGLEAIFRSQPACIFLDLGMPLMTGYEVAARIRKMSDIRQPLLFAYTAWDDPQTKIKIIESGFDYLIKKTLGIEEILSILKCRLVRHPTG